MFLLARSVKQAAQRVSNMVWECAASSLSVRLAEWLLREDRHAEGQAAPPRRQVAMDRRGWSPLAAYQRLLELPGTRLADVAQDGPVPGTPSGGHPTLLKD